MVFISLTDLSSIGGLTIEYTAIVLGISGSAVVFEENRILNNLRYSLVFYEVN